MRSGLRYVLASTHSPLSICTQCCLYACNVPHTHSQTMCLHGHGLVIASTATRSFALCLFSHAFSVELALALALTVSYDNLGYARTILNACDHVHERVYTHKRTLNILILKVSRKSISPKSFSARYLRDTAKDTRPGKFGL